VNDKKPNLKNNGVRRRASKVAAKVEGKKVPFNAGAPRSVTRKMMGLMVQCEECGDKMLMRNLNAHVTKALMHAPPKKIKRAAKPKPELSIGPQHAPSH